MQALHSYYMINERYVYNANESSQGYDHIKLAQLYYNLALTLAAAWHADKSFLDVPHSAAYTVSYFASRFSSICGSSARWLALRFFCRFL